MEEEFTHTQEGGTVLKFSHRDFGEISERSSQRFPEGWKQLLAVNLPDYLERSEMAEARIVSTNER